MDTNLNDNQKSQLDGIVQKMTAEGQTPSNIQFVVNDFKSKYGTKPVGVVDNFLQGGANIAKDIAGIEKNKSTSIIPSIIKSTIGSEGIAGVAQLPGRVISTAIASGDQVRMQQEQQNEYDRGTQLRQQLASESDPTKKELLKKAIESSDNLIKTYNDNINNFSGFKTTTGEALGTTANAALTVATGAKPNLLGEVTPALQTLKKSTSFITPTLKAVNIGGRIIENAALGAGFNTANNLINDRPLSENLASSALLGGIIPIVGAGASKLTNAVTSKIAPSAEGLINSLIKPLQKDFAYGKNPARGILNEGIVANDLSSLSVAVNSKASEIGRQIGAVGSKLEQSGVALNLTPALAPLDEAMRMAAKSNNPTLLNSLNNVKIALAHDLGLSFDEAGSPVINKGSPKNLVSTTYNGAVQFLSDIRDHTRFTGNPSDDKALNMATKQAYGITRNIMNTTADKVSPELGVEIRNLNERYADLSSAKNAIAHRDIVEKRQNIINLAGKFSIPVAITGALLSGNLTHAATILAGEAGLLVAGKVLGSAATKTRVAQFLNAIAPQERQALLNSNNPLKNWYRRTAGKESGVVSPYYSENKAPILQAGSTNAKALAAGTAATVAGIALGKTGQVANYYSSDNPVTATPEQNKNVVAGVDISSYATDPKHEEKIARIYDANQGLATSTDIDNHIKRIAPNSPITGDMVTRIANEFKVDFRLLLSIIQNDSSFGTKGVAVRTKNVGNVGNTGNATTTFKTWEEGLRAAARTLAHHKVSQ